MGYRVGVDVGGTFTDVLLIDEASGETWRSKTASTPHDQSEAVLKGILKACEEAGAEPGEIVDVLHGTTVATNAILEGKGAKVGLVTTRGFRQVLQIGRSYVPGGLAGWIIWPKPKPLASLELTIEANERVATGGEVVEELDEDDLRAKLEKLARKGIEALCVSLINSFANPAHEQRVLAIATEVMPDVPVSLSSVVLPELREYERTVTTVANGYVQPQVKKYLSNLESKLSTGGIHAELAILRSDGGLSAPSVAIDNPVSMLLSGPAGGVTGAAWIAKSAGYSDFLTFDMGGTSTDVALVEGLRPRIGRETNVGDLRVRATSVDVRTVGAGGGSIAHVPQLTQALRVGPQSAGAVPGPAAYGIGGTEPTVTDANVVLGYLPQELAGGEITLALEDAREAVGTIVETSGLPDVETAAAGIIDIVNENMLGALRLVSVQQGFDPREFALVAFGGAGPLHANALGRLLGSWPVIIPPSPGVLNAYGDAMTSLRDESSRTYIHSLSSLTDEELGQTLDELAAPVTQSLAAQGVDEAHQSLTFQVDVRYHGQGFELTIDVERSSFETGGKGLDQLREAFEEEHGRLFSFALDNDHEIVNLRATAAGPSPEIAMSAIGVGTEDSSGACTRDLEIWVEGAPTRAGHYDRSKLLAGNVIEGPAIVTEMDSTTLVLPDHTATVDPSGCLLINPKAV